MVKEINKNYECEECFLVYSDKELANKCEVWCKEQHSCNIDITKHAINKEEIQN